MIRRVSSRSAATESESRGSERRRKIKEMHASSRDPPLEAGKPRAHQQLLWMPAALVAVVVVAAPEQLMLFKNIS